MSLNDGFTHSHTINAFFDTRGAAQQATDDLVAAGVARDQIEMLEGADRTVEQPAKRDMGFWDTLKNLFIPDEDRYTYAEGLNRGGYLLSVKADSQSYDQILDILDQDGAVNMDERQGDWQREGWSGFTAGAIPAGSDTGQLATPTSAITGTPTMADATTIGSASRAASTVHGDVTEQGRRPVSSNDLTGTIATEPSSFADDDAIAVGTRDLSHGRTRVRSYLMDPVAQNNQQVSQSRADVDLSATGGTLEGLGMPFSADKDRSRIAEHMTVISADGQDIGKVDHLDGPDRIKLTKNDSPDHQHHFVPFAWIDHVDQHVHLNKTLAEIKSHV